MDKKNQDQQSSRWWEFYAIRYGVGTIVGAIIVFLLCTNNKTLMPLLLVNDPKTIKIDSTMLSLLFGYGLTFCYLASAPILVFHTSRFKIDVDNLNGRSSLRSWAVLVIPPFFLTVLYMYNISKECGLTNINSLLFFVGITVISAQYYAIFQALLYPDKLFEFYKILAKKRSSGSGGFVESYKHLREHGNSFLIVLLEIVLALLLIVTPDFNRSVFAYATTIFIWIMPAALVWLVGTAIERKFIDD